MTQNVTFQTARGSAVELSIATETINLADHNSTMPCYELRLTVNGKTTGSNIDRVEHPEHGPALKVGQLLVPVPAESLAAVDALIAEYRTTLRARLNESLAAESEYETHRAKMRNIMGY